MSPADFLVAFAASVVAGGFYGLWRHSAHNREAIAKLELDVARNYVTASQMAGLRAEFHELRQEIRRMSELLIRLETLIEPTHGNG